MFSVFDIIGVMLRGAAALGFAALCGWSSLLAESGRQTQLMLLGQGGPMILVGLGAVAIFAGFYGMIALLRETRRRPADKDIGQDQPDFDPDAIMARHVAWRAANPPAAARRPRSGFYQPPRRSFGRRAV